DQGDGREGVEAGAHGPIPHSREGAGSGRVAPAGIGAGGEARPGTQYAAPRARDRDGGGDRRRGESLTAGGPARAARYNQSVERETEVELARQLLAGNPAAFDRFVEHFRSKIFQYSWMMCGHREDAEEVAQETLLKVFENFEQLREPERVRSWVFRIAKNACLMKRRKSVFAPAQELSLDELMPVRHGD